jgi:hypothetical protein
LKECKRCAETKDYDQFRKYKQNKDGKDNVCKDCRKEEYRKNPVQKRYYERNKEKIGAYRTKYIEENRDYYTEYNRQYRRENHEQELKRISEYRKNNLEKYNQHQKNRRKLQNLLDILHEEVDESSVYAYFNNSCALSQSNENLTLDHFIPIAWGHGGSYIGNLFPLQININQSKNRQNPFEWYKWAKDELNIDEHCWIKLLEYLSSMSDLTVEQFKEFVYWCEENKRTPDDLQENEYTSLEQWRSKE